MKAEKIFYGKHIVTMDDATEGAQAVAVAGGKIVKVGSREEVQPLCDAGTEVVELGDKALVPGFIDCHCHFGVGALLIDWVNLQYPPYGEGDSIASIQRVLKEALKEKKLAPGEWLLGAGYTHLQLKEARHLTRDDLDAVSTEHPIVVMHSSLHFFSANSLGLKIIGIDENTEDPVGGHIRRVEGTNIPNGVCEGTVRYRVLQHVPLGNLEDALRRIVKMQDLFAQYGMTTMQDGATQPNDMPLFLEAARRGLFKADLAYYPDTAIAAKCVEDEQCIKDHYDNRLRMAGIKMVADGSPFGTSKLRTPYATCPEGVSDPSHDGLMYYTEEQMRDYIALAFKSGQQLMVHTNGDKCIDIFLSCYESVAKEMKADLSKRRDIVLHAMFIHEEQVIKVKELHLMISFLTPRIAYPGNTLMDELLGTERTEHIAPVGYALKHGVPFTMHVDYPCINPDTMMLLDTTVNRRSSVDRSRVYGADLPKVPVREALKGLTITAAYQYFEEDSKGSITEGKLADMVVLDANPLTVDPEDLLKIQILETIKEGETIYMRK